MRGLTELALFIPDINKWEDWEVSIVDVLETVDYALIDASFFADGELGDRDMSQIPHPFVSETMALFVQSSAEVRNKIWFIHMNQSNPSWIRAAMPVGSCRIEASMSPGKASDCRCKRVHLRVIRKTGKVKVCATPVFQNCNQ